MWEDYENIEIVGCEEPFMRSPRQTKVSKTKPMNFLMEEFERSVKPKDFISWKRFNDFADR